MDDGDPFDDLGDLLSEFRRIGDVEERVERDHDLVLETKPVFVQQSTAPRGPVRALRNRSRRRDLFDRFDLVGLVGLVGFLGLCQLLRSLRRLLNDIATPATGLRHVALGLSGGAFGEDTSYPKGLNPPASTDSLRPGNRSVSTQRLQTPLRPPDRPAPDGPPAASRHAPRPEGVDEHRVVTGRLIDRPASPCPPSG